MAEIGLDGSGFERGLNRIGREAGASVRNLAVQAFGIYGVEQAIAKTVETADELVNTSKRLDVTVEQLQLLRQAAKEGGTEMDTLASAFEKLDIARAKALSGDKTAIAAFAKLGVSQAQLTTQTAATIFTGSLSNAAKSNNVESLAPAFREVLGKGFGELLPVLKTDFDDLGSKMHKLGNIMDAETAVKLKAMSDQFEILSTVAAVRLGPVLVQLGVWILQAVGGLKQLAAFLGAVANQGARKGIGAISKATNDSVIDLLPDFLAKPLKKGSDAYYKTLFGVDPDEADKLLTQGGDAANDAGKEWKDMMDKLDAQLKAAADELNHPKPIIPDITGEAGKAKSPRSFAAAASDSLVRVGNFLNSNGNTISRVDQRKIDLLTKIAKNTESKGSFQDKLLFTGLGIPPA